jgi:hypothetical protein
MSIKPIDLQTLFLQLGQVGKQQSAIKDGAVLQQAIHGATLQKLEDEAAKSVRRADDDALESRAIQPDPDGHAGRRESGSKQHDDEEADSTEQETIRDPALGGLVDISG